MVADAPAAPYTLNDLQNLSPDSAYYQHHYNYQNIRNRAIKQAAEKLGIQSGLAAEAKSIDAQLRKRSSQLDQIFNFRQVMYRNNVLPPVIERARNSVNVGPNSQQMRIGGVTYNIIQQVRFVSTPPTWRDYLWMDYPEPPLPNKVLLPKNSEERALWGAALTAGWQEGVKQAIGIYHLNLHRMVRDFDGMLLYKGLLLKNMVTPFHVTKAAHGVTGNGAHMVVDDQTWTIANQPQLQLYNKFWEPVVVKQSGE